MDKAEAILARVRISYQNDILQTDRWSKASSTTLSTALHVVILSTMLSKVISDLQRSNSNFFGVRVMIIHHHHSCDMSSDAPQERRLVVLISGSGQWAKSMKTLKADGGA